MNKPLEQIQEENRKAIIMACNPDAKSYEEALEMEIKMGSIIRLNNLPLGEKVIECIINKDNDIFIAGYDTYLNRSQYTPIGKPLTLNRVLIALNQDTLINNQIYCYGILLGQIVRYTEEQDIDILADWDLTKETLEEQSEETQLMINELLV